MEEINIKPLASIKTSESDSEIEVEVLQFENNDNKDSILNQQLTDIKLEIDNLSNKINRLENNGDTIDYAVSAGCGVLAGLIDAFFVGEFSISDNSSLTRINSMKAKASSLGENNVVLSIIKELETNNSNGLLNGIIKWCFNITSLFAKNPNMMIKGTPKDISNTLKEFSSLAPFKNSDKKIAGWTSDLISGKVLKDENNKSLDFLSYINANNALQIGKQCIPVLINEILVRLFYFIRQLIKIVKENNIKSIRQLNKIILKNTIPFNNRTIVRMMSIATTTMTSIDLVDALINSLIKSNGNQINFMGGFLLRINYVGVGRTIIALTTDMIMGIELHNRRNDRIKLMNEYNAMANKKIFYKENDVWVQAIDTKKAIDEAIIAQVKANDTLIKSMNDNKENMKKISNNIDSAENKNPGLKEDIKNIIDWE